MDCKDRILSNDYFDILTDFPVGFAEARSLDMCYSQIGNQYSIIYLNRSALTDVNKHLFDYKSVPKLYGLMQQEEIARGFDPNSMIVSGITQVQREPLELTGRGVVICLIDTGECVRIVQKAG